MKLKVSLTAVYLKLTIHLPASCSSSPQMSPRGRLGPGAPNNPGLIAHRPDPLMPSERSPGQWTGPGSPRPVRPADRTGHSGRVRRQSSPANRGEACCFPVRAPLPGRRSVARRAAAHIGEATTPKLMTWSPNPATRLPVSTRKVSRRAQESSAPPVVAAEVCVTVATRTSARRAVPALRTRTKASASRMSPEAPMHGAG